MPIIDSLRALSSGSVLYPFLSPLEKPLPCIITAVLLLVAYLALGESNKGKAGFPVANPKRPFEFNYFKRVAEFQDAPREHFAKYRDQYPDTPYWINTELGKVLILPSSMINEIRVNSNMSSMAAIQEIQNGSLKGFEPIGEVLDAEMLKLVKENLTIKNLGKMTQSVSAEVSEALQDIFSDSQEWKEFLIGEPIVHLVARPSSRVFGGKTFCRSTAWLEAMADYTKHFLYASIALRFFPKWSKPLVQWALPPCILLRKDLEVCRKIIKPIIEQRQAEMEAATLDGADVEYAFDQAFGTLKKKVDMATAHIVLAMVAIHTTADLLLKTLVAFIEHPELVEPLRQEVIKVISVTGLNDAGLARLNLMDSVLKEVQRRDPVANCFLNRIALDDLPLSNGMVMPKGTLCGVGPTHMWDNGFYENGDKFDGYRFLRMREDPARRQQSYLVSTSPEHLGFGHGSHACPGRFFASNEVKILLSHLILKYEWKLPDGSKPNIINWGVLNAVHPETKLLLRRRREELDLDSLVV